MATTFDLNSSIAQARALRTHESANHDEKAEVMSRLRATSDRLQGTYDKLLEMWSATSWVKKDWHIRSNRQKPRLASLNLRFNAMTSLWKTRA